MTVVLQIIPSLGAGGAEQACVDVTAGLEAAGHTAIVVSSGGPRVDEIVKAGGRHVTRSVETKNPLKMFANARWLANFIRENKVDIVHARSRAPAWSAYWATRRTSKAFVTTNHAAYKFDSGIKKFYNGIMMKGDRIIAISDFVARHIQEHYRVATDKIRTIPRGVDLTWFSPQQVTDERRNRLRRAWGLEDGRRPILLPSRLSPIKGQTVLIEAMALLPPSLNDTTAIILGDDQGRLGYRQELERQIAAKSLEARVKLVEHCQDMPAAYSMAKLVIAPSLVPEGFGRVPVEAMAMGVGVIATELGGFTETVTSGANGWLVPPNNPEALASAIVKAFSQTPEEFEAGQLVATQHVHTRYDKNKMVADTLAVYAELAPRR